MANYIINECITNDVYILSAATLTLGATVEFDISEARFCGTVGAVTESTETLNISFVQLHDDCCACLSGLTESLNFNFIICGTELEINIEAFNFCSEHGLPITGMTYELQLGSYVPFCATFQGLSESGETNYHYSSGPFSLCENCGEEPPRSAGTEYEVCEICCDCGSTGSTINLITPPHPVYTDGYGTPVTQLNMVTLGGPNGLNS
jgi:hypothetical protein